MALPATRLKTIRYDIPLMKRYILAAMATIVLSCTTMAAEPDSAAVNIVNVLNRDGKITVDQPEGLTHRLERRDVQVERVTGEENSEAKAASSATARSRSGYRVEVFADNNVRTAKAQASNRKRLLQARLPQYRVYLVFESPFWRVRLGDFPTRAGAESALAEVRRVLPQSTSSLRIVRCAINH